MDWISKTWTGFVKHELDGVCKTWICKTWICKTWIGKIWTGLDLQKKRFVQYGFENKYFVILFLEEIFIGKIRCLRLRLILFGLSIPTLREFMWWLHLTINCYHQFSNFPYPLQVLCFLSISLFPLQKKTFHPGYPEVSGKIRWPLAKIILHNLKRARKSVFRV